MVKALISGGAGFIGSHLVENLSKQGEELIVLDDFSAGIHNLNLLKTLETVTLVEGNILDSELVNKLVAKSSKIYHLAAMNRAQHSIENPLNAHEVNLTGTLNILEAARKYDVEKVVFASSSSVYGVSQKFPRREDGETKPAHPYAVGKLASEHYCNVYYHLFGLKIKILRYFAVYGPRQSSTLKYAAVIPIFIRNLIEKKPITVYGDGTQRRNFTFVDDTVKATIAAMKSNKATGKTINISNEKEISLNEVIKHLEKIVNYPIQIIYQDWRKGDAKRAPADISLAKTILGLTPETTIEQGLKKTYDWTINNLNFF